MNKRWSVGVPYARQFSLSHHVSLILLEHIHDPDL
jgi:hypothetical protein